MLHLRRRGWGRLAPPVGARVDWGHPLAAGIVNAILFNAGGGAVQDAVDPTLIGTPASGAAWTTTRLGLGVRGGGGIITMPDARLTLPSRGLTVAALVQFDSGGPELFGRVAVQDRPGIVVPITTGTADDGITVNALFMSLQADDASTVSRATANNFIADGDYGWFVYTWDGGLTPASIRCYKALYSTGAVIEATYQATFDSTATATPTPRGDWNVLNRPALDRDFDGVIHALYTFGVVWELAQVQSLFMDPYGLFALPAPRRRAGAAGGGGGGGLPPGGFGLVGVGR